MDSRLFVKIGFVNNMFQAIDESPYDRWINDGHFDNQHKHLVAHRLLHISDDNSPQQVVLEKTVARTVESIKEPFEVKDVTNGLYYYQKIIIPLADHITDTNERLYWDGSKVCYEDLDTGDFQTFSLKTIDSFDDVYDIIRNKLPDNCFYYDEYSLTIFDLIQCYVLTERERINNYLKNNCHGLCENTYSDLDERADILLAAIMVIKDLMRRGDFFEAQRILNGLQTCGNLCKKYMNSLKGCGCG